MGRGSALLFRQAGEALIKLRVDPALQGELEGQRNCPVGLLLPPRQAFSSKTSVFAAGTSAGSMSSRSQFSSYTKEEPPGLFIPGAINLKQVNPETTCKERTEADPAAQTASGNFGSCQAHFGKQSLGRKA